MNASLHPPVHDLRSALDFLRTLPGQYHETDVSVRPMAELAGVYRHIGGGGTVMRPTRTGPAMVFNTIEGYPGSRVAIGVLACRKRAAALLGVAPRDLGRFMEQAVRHRLEPVLSRAKEAPCQEQVHLASDPGFDLRALLPAPTNTPEDAGPYITMGLVYGADPDNGEEDVTIHRLCVQGPDELSMWLTPGRHLEAFRERAEARGEAMPVSINIGLDPAVYLASCFEPPTTPQGLNELAIAGALRGRPVELTPCVSIRAKAIANAEIVIEGELLPGVRMREDQNTNTGKAMPEFPGYTGPAAPSLPVIKVRAVTHRKNPIMQTCIGPGEEHVCLAGIPTEASILGLIERSMPGRLHNVYAHPSGGGKFLAILQFEKKGPADEGRQRQAALTALAAYTELKNVIVVDEDVDIFDSDDVLWAMNTRMQADVDIITIPGVRCHPLDPSQEPGMSPAITQRGMSCKTIFDCTVPFDQKARFARARFMDVDPEPFLKGYRP